MPFRIECKLAGLVVLLGTSLLLTESSSAQQQEAIAQATTASEYTGAPMLVIAGRETCPNCKRLIDQLGGREFGRLTRAMVPLKIDVDEPEWRTWAGKYGRPNGSTLPFVYVVRADGETLHSHSGPMETEQLANVIGSQLQNAGRPLTERQINSIAEAVEEAKQALADDQPAQAIRELAALKRIGDLGQLGSYAKAAVEADQLVGRLVADVQGQIGDVSQRLDSQDDQLKTCFDVVHALRVYGAIPAVKTELAQIVSRIRRERELRDVLQTATEIDRACKLCENSSTLERGIESLKQFVEENPDTPIAELAQAQLEAAGE